MSFARKPNIGVLLEQTLGHVSHGRNLRRTLLEAENANVLCRDIDYEPVSRLDRIPPRTNWTVRSGLTARNVVNEWTKTNDLDGLLVHTHVPATFLSSAMRRIPTVVSIDATPRQIDSLGESYDHRVGPDFVETAKWRMHARCFSQAASLVSWSKWAADSLVTDYGIDRDRIEVIPPGVVLPQWLRKESIRSQHEPIRILFVGGDFKRKGGTLLLDAFRRLKSDPEVVRLGLELELHLVTSADVGPETGVHVHHGLTANSQPLIDLYHRCDIFALPTLGDCTPLVLAEASAAGLPSVATKVGGIPESVRDGQTGYLVDPTVESLTMGLRRLVIDKEHRLLLGHQAEQHARETMDAEKNARRLLHRVLESAGRKASVRTVLTVSGRVAPNIDRDIAVGKRPLADYVAISRATQAELLDWADVKSNGSPLTRLIQRFAGNSVATAVHLFQRRADFDTIITDGEQIGLPLAALFRLHRGPTPHHIMIGHRLSPTKKLIPIRTLGLSAGIDDVLVYSSSQLDVAKRLFNRRSQRVRLIDFMVDTEFFRPGRSSKPAEDARPMICAAGREFRDYPTLIEAVRGLNVDVVIASASPWSKRPDNSHTVDLPENVQVTALTQRKLRDLLDRSAALVMPLQETDFQAGITTILEAMAMERPVVSTQTAGQTDVIVDGLNGRYVPPGDADALRSALKEIIDRPTAAAAMGKRGRALVEERADVRIYAQIFADMVNTRPSASPLVGDLAENVLLEAQPPRAS